MKPVNFCAAWCAIALPENDGPVWAGDKLFADLGLKYPASDEVDHPALAWRRSGLFDLSGTINGPARMVPVDLTTAVNGAISTLKSLSNLPEKLPINGAMLLGERSRLMGLARNGRSSPGGYCRLIDTLDGRIGLNLARDEDWDLLEAWLETPATSWEGVSQAALKKQAAALVERGSELGLAIARSEIPQTQPWLTEEIFTPGTNGGQTPLVVDLSSLWAGPLTASLLGQMGARVIKVESPSRPDGGRRGNEQFYDLLNTGKQSVAFDFVSEEGRSSLKRLIEAADIVIEASRPRALRQLGIDASMLVAQKPGKLWLRLTAYGAETNRIGFGDDIGVATGLSAIMETAWGKPLFVGDAIADPVSGVFGALAAWVKWTSGGGRVVNLSMRDLLRKAMGNPKTSDDHAVIALEWQAMAEHDASPLYPMRIMKEHAEKLGASTEKIMADL